MTEQEFYQALAELQARTGWDNTGIMQCFVTFTGDRLAEFLEVLREIERAES